MGYRISWIQTVSNHPTINFDEFDFRKVYYSEDNFKEAISFIEDFLERKEGSLEELVDFKGSDDLFCLYIEPDNIETVINEEEIIKLEELLDWDDDEEHILFTAYMVTKVWRNSKELSSSWNDYYFEQG